MRRIRHSALVGALAAAMLAAGCGEPTGDDAYGQKFEKPGEGAAAASDSPPPDNFRTRRQEIEESQKNPEPPPKKGRGRR